MTAGMLLLTAGCTTPNRPYPYAIPPAEASADQSLANLATAIAMETPATDVLSAAPGMCGATATPVVRFVVQDQVLFATDSDQPSPAASAALDMIASRIRQNAPGADLTVLGHTDAIGSDAYNMDLSKRRAETVLRDLVARGLDPAHLSAVAIGKRQPVADNATAEGRAQNRRVVFLVSRCLAANLSVVAGTARDRALLDPDVDAASPVNVIRLDPAAPDGLAQLAIVSLHTPEGDQPAPIRAAAPARSAAQSPAVGVAQPAPAPHYQPRTLSPAVQPNPLGPAVPF